MVSKVGVLQGLLGRDALAGLIGQHLLQQVQALLVEAGHRVRQRLSGPLGEGGLVVGQLRHAGPCLLRGRAQRAEDAEKLVDLRVAGEQRAAGGGGGEGEGLFMNGLFSDG